MPSDVAKIQLRLAGQKRKHSEGRVEVYYDGQWGTVCDDDSIHAAHVVCRELGYVEAKAWTASSYGKGKDPSGWTISTAQAERPPLPPAPMAGVSPTASTQKTWAWCAVTKGFLVSNLTTHWSTIENLNIQVEDIRIRAILSAYRKRTPVTEGYVEVKDGKTWKQICDKHWTAKNSRVVCGMFGFPGRRRTTPKCTRCSPPGRNSATGPTPWTAQARRLISPAASLALRCRWTP